jgi:hypothetical protein
MDREKAMDKIEKCLRLSKSSEPAEAAAALRQAQKMMAAHGITEADLGAAGYGDEKVSCPIQVNVKVNLVLNQLIWTIRDAFGVDAVLEHEKRVTDYSYAVRYIGPNDRVKLAAYAHTVVYRAMTRAWEKHIIADPWVKRVRGARAGFQLGWLETVRSQITALAMTDEDKTGVALVRQRLYGRELTKSKVNGLAVDGNAMQEGKAAASDFRLNRPVGEQALRLGVKK